MNKRRTFEPLKISKLLKNFSDQKPLKKGLKNVKLEELWHKKMGKNIIVSNRLPIRISKLNNSFEFTTTTGGLATGMKSFHSENNSLWIGWPGIGIDEIDNNHR